MKKNITIFTVLPVLLALLLGGCTVGDPDSSTDLVAPSGDQLFTNYVSIGNSLTAGFMDGGLSITGQMGSYPKLIAGQIGTPEFTQPYISMPGVGTTDSGDPAVVNGVLYWDGGAPSVLGTTSTADVMDPASGFLMAMTQPTPYHNLAVPGATLHDVMNAVDATTSSPLGNTFFNFINRPTFFGNVSVPAVPDVSPAYETASMFRAAVANGPKLLTCWIGNNDILGSAMSGTDEEVTDPAVFTAEFTALMQSLAGGLIQRNGFPTTIVVANIPSITSIAYFVPIAFLETPIDEGGLGVDWPWGYEEADAQFVTLPALSWFLDAGNMGDPLPEDLSLSVSETTNIETAVQTYNGVITGVVAAINASLTGEGPPTIGIFDANSLLAAQPTLARTHFMFLAPALGVPTAAATTMFSLDGVHPNSVGYGIVANGFIEVIEELTGTEIADVDLSSLSWDPTYGQAPDPAKVGQPWSLDPVVAEGMGAIFR